MEIKNNGTTIIIVSHSLGQIEQICERSIWIHEGVVRAEGTPRSVHREYLAYMGEQRNKKNVQEENVSEQTDETKESVVIKTDKYSHVGSGDILITDVYVTDKKGKRKQAFESAEDILINVDFAVKKPIEKANFGISIIRNDGLCCFGTSTKGDDMDFLSVSKNGKIQLALKSIALFSGRYGINVGIEDNARNGIDYVDQACIFDVYTTTEEVGAFYMDHKWDLSI